jgi:hypothetical protein
MDITQESAMRRPRFTIASLLGLVVFLAVGLAALRAATDTWDSGVFGVTLSLLLFSLVLVIHRIERRRAYWLGFALFGWAYLLMSMVPTVEVRLPTTKALAYLDSKVSGRMTGWTFVLSTNGVGGPTGNPYQGATFSLSGSPPANNQLTTVRLWDATTGKLLGGPSGTSENFLRIGHSLLALVMAFLGGGLSRWMYDKNQTSRQDESVDSPTEPT